MGELGNKDTNKTIEFNHMVNGMVEQWQENKNIRKSNDIDKDMDGGEEQMIQHGDKDDVHEEAEQELNENYECIDREDIKTLNSNNVEELEVEHASIELNQEIRQ